MESTLCNNCGHQYQQDSIFCDYCGTKIDPIFISGQTDATFTPNTPLNIEMNTDEIETILKNQNQKNYRRSIMSFSEDDRATIPNLNLKTELDHHPNNVTLVPTEIDGTVLEKKQPTLTLVHCKSQANFIFPFEKKILRIGRVNDTCPVDIDLSNLERSDIVSRLHLIIFVESDRYFLEDAGSSNGTFVNGQEIKKGENYRIEIQSGDEIILGKKTQLKFVFKVIV